MEQVRLFIAIGLDAVLKDELVRVQTQLREARELRSVRWVSPKNIHLTFNFLGNVERVKIPSIVSAMLDAANTTSQFELSARGLGCFPNTRRANNIWVGLEGNVQTAALLASALESNLAELGFPRDARGFTPHLTLGRVKREASNVDREGIGQVIQTIPPRTLGVIHADAIHLIASVLRSTGPVYTTIESAQLRAKDSAG